MYYNPFRRTITKPLIYITEAQLRDEVRSLLYLGYVTNRTVLLPNILGNELTDISDPADEDVEGVESYRERALWPAFRVAFFKKEFNLKIDIVEPAFYWRIARDYPSSTYSGISIPKPTVVDLGLALTTNRALAGSEKDDDNILSIHRIEELLNQDNLFRNAHRLVLHMPGKKRLKNLKQSPRLALNSTIIRQLIEWASDSVGGYRSFAEESEDYGTLPALNERWSVSNKKGSLYLNNKRKQRDDKITTALEKSHQPSDALAANQLVHNVRLCAKIMHPNKGNRSCFDKCD